MCFDHGGATKGPLSSGRRPCLVVFRLDRFAWNGCIVFLSRFARFYEFPRGLPCGLDPGEFRQTMPLQRSCRLTRSRVTYCAAPRSQCAVSGADPAVSRRPRGVCRMACVESIQRPVWPVSDPAKADRVVGLLDRLPRLALFYFGVGVPGRRGQRIRAHRAHGTYAAAPPPPPNSKHHRRHRPCCQWLDLCVLSRETANDRLGDGCNKRLAENRRGRRRGER